MSNNDGVLSYSEVLAEKKLEEARLQDMKYYRTMAPGVHLPNRVNANPSDRTINKGADEDIPNSRYLSR